MGRNAVKGKEEVGSADGMDTRERPRRSEGGRKGCGKTGGNCMERSVQLHSITGDNLTPCTATAAAAAAAAADDDGNTEWTNSEQARHRHDGHTEHDDKIHLHIKPCDYGWLHTGAAMAQHGQS
ncbi:hypothetical protein INR49_006937 [Caranx melampygus]|nr:hypothetical protein INR49_006937 [Caranx melampygus]